MSSKHKAVASVIELEAEASKKFLAMIEGPISATQKAAIERSAGVYEFYKARWKKANS